MRGVTYVVNASGVNADSREALIKLILQLQINKIGIKMRRGTQLNYKDPRE